MIALLAQPSGAVSYLFSGMFIGPTSQAPRVDEARNDSVYEIEIAFAELRASPRHAGQSPPWLVDRLLRNLLIDVTGNTHRAEFCIDKLYSPDGATGRLGLLEMRAFEMPPHARMSLAQQLLMRALVARFWARAVPAGAAGALGHRAARPLHAAALRLAGPRATCVDELRDVGYPLELEWFAPHLEFRFPLLGDFAAARRRASSCAWRSSPGTCSARRAAAAAPRATSTRSLERLQVKVDRPRRRPPRRHLQRPARAAAADRHRRRVRRRRALPRLAAAVGAASDDRRARAAGLRPRRHLDRAARSAAASTTSPIRAAATTTTFPVNAYEAEARRLARFFRTGHTPGRDAGAAGGAATRTFRSRSTCGGPQWRDAPAHRARPGRDVGARRAAPWTLSPDPAARRLRRPGRPLRRDARGAGRSRGRTGTRSCASLAERGEREVSDTLSLTERQIREHGITYNVYADAKGAEPALGGRPAAAAAAGRRVGSRSRPASRSAPTCSTACSATSTGRRTLLQSGAIPPPVVFGHRGFLRAGARPRAGRRPAPAAVRRRPRALARRPLVGGQRPHAGAVGRRLRAREPADRLARLPAAVPRAAGAAPRVASSTRCATALLRWAPRGDGPPRDRRC